MAMTNAIAENSSALSAADSEVTEMLEAGVHLGHVRSKRHPAMGPYVWGLRSNVEVIDLSKTRELLAAALAFLSDAARAGKLVLFVGTRPASKDIVRRTAEATSCPYVDQRWIGGTLTNFKVIRKRVETLEGLEQEQASGGFEKYTKWEQLELEKDMARLRQNFDGLRRLVKLPEVVVISDISHDTSALQEARRLGIPVVALTDTNTDPRLVTYPIPANDDARPAVSYMFGRMQQAIRDGEVARAADAAEKATVSQASVDEAAREQQ